MAKNLKSAVGWSALEQVGQYLAQFVPGIILARLLSPAEFGLIGMLAVFFDVTAVFTDAGLASAIIQRRRLSDDDTTSCFYLNVVAGTLLAGLLCLVSPLVARFYATPVLAPILCVLSLQLIIGSFRAVQDALRARDLDFRTLAVANWSASLSAGSAGIVLAWAGYGVWSLVAQTVLRVLVGTMVLWTLRPWRPRGQFCWSSIAELWPFSSRLLAASLLEAVFKNAYSVVIGKMYSPADLGYYTRAQQLAALPSYSLASVCGRVALPYFSRIQEDMVLLKQRLRQLLRLTATLTFPLMIGIAAAASSLVTALLTDKWASCVPLVQVLSFCGLLYPLHLYHTKVITALGRSDLFLRLELIKKTLIVTCLAICAPFGVFAMALGSLAVSIIAYWINSYYTRRFIYYSWAEQIKDLLPMLTAGGVVGVVGVASGFVGFANPWAKLACQVLAMTLVFMGLAIGLHRTWFADSFSILAKASWFPSWLRHPKSSNGVV